MGFLGSCVFGSRDFSFVPLSRMFFSSTVLEDRDGVFLHGKGLVLWLGDPYKRFGLRKVSVPQL